MNALELHDITLSYGKNQVLSGISLHIEPGEIAALVGENGAGKSSLAKIIAGAIKPESGTISVGGKSVTLSNPRDALLNGIAFIPQELVYAPHLTVAENIYLGRVPTKRGLTSSRAILSSAQDIADRLGFDIPVAATMGELPLMQQQLVEILKAISREPRVLVLDEPTAALESADSLNLLDLVGGLAERGVGVLYISHRLDEVFRSCRTVHVLRGGVLVDSRAIADSEPKQIVHSMLDRSLSDATIPKQSVRSEREVLRLENWSRQHPPQLAGVSLAVREGEVVGLYGVRGAGAETIAEALAGMHPDVRGDTFIDSKHIAPIKSPAQSRKHGISYVPADRKSQGLLLGHSVMDSLALPSLRMLSAFGFIRRAKERAWGQEVTRKMLVKFRGLNQPVAELSGGNQQKILVGSRSLGDTPALLVVQEPTRGVDIGSRREIHLQLRELAERGMSILMVTSDLDEAVILSDRLLIIRGGQIVREITNPTPESEPEAFSYAGGLVNEVD